MCVCVCVCVCMTEQGEQKEREITDRKYETKCKHEVSHYAYANS